MLLTLGKVTLTATTSLKYSNCLIKMLSPMRSKVSSKRAWLTSAAAMIKIVSQRSGDKITFKDFVDFFYKVD
jgi:hypothetical protein